MSTVCRSPSALPVQPAPHLAPGTGEQPVLERRVIALRSRCAHQHRHVMSGIEHRPITAKTASVFGNDHASLAVAALIGRHTKIASTAVFKAS